MSIESAKTIEETNSNYYHGKDVIIQNLKASQLSGVVSVYDLNTCPTELTMNQQQQMKPDLAKTSSVNDMWNDTYNTSGNNYHNFEEHMSVSRDVGHPYWIKSVPDYVSTNLHLNALG